MPMYLPIQHAPDGSSYPFAEAFTTEAAAEAAVARDARRENLKLSDYTIHQFRLVGPEPAAADAK